MKQVYKIVVAGGIYTVIAKDDIEAKDIVLAHTNNVVLNEKFTLSRIAVASSEHTCGVIGVEVDSNPKETFAELLKAAMRSNNG